MFNFSQFSSVRFFLPGSFPRFGSVRFVFSSSVLDQKIGSNQVGSVGPHGLNAIIKYILQMKWALSECKLASQKDTNLNEHLNYKNKRRQGDKINLRKKQKRYHHQKELSRKIVTFQLFAYCITMNLYMYLCAKSRLINTFRKKPKTRHCQGIFKTVHRDKILDTKDARLKRRFGYFFCFVWENRFHLTDIR